MGLRTKKLIGTILLLVLITVYSLVVTSVAITVLPQAGKWAELAFYMVAGLIWVAPAALIIHWMHRQ